MPSVIVYSVNTNNTKTVFQRAMDEIAELEQTQAVIDYKAAKKIAKEYKGSARTLIVPELKIRSTQVIVKSLGGMPAGFEQMPRSKNTTKTPNASDGLNFLYMGMKGRINPIPPREDFGYKMQTLKPLLHLESQIIDSSTI